MAKNVYIHIPFCKSKCNYCTFVSFSSLELKRDYLKALKKQILSEYKGDKLNTLYFGGGTPSNLSVAEFKELIDLFELEDNAEITTELNPERVSKEYLTGLMQIGINRLSIGAQTFDDHILSLIGRRHNSEQIEIIVKMAQEVGFENISLDFIYGLPTQTLEGFNLDLQRALSIGITHISLYGLKIEEGCKFYDEMPADLPDLDEQADMYLSAIDLLVQSGVEHYEISNFSKESFNSKHNLNYWKNNSYYGFGTSASGYIDKIRYTNEDDLKKYIENPLAKISEQTLTHNEILEEAIFLGFRKITGLNISEINNTFSIDFEEKYAKILDKYLETGHLIKTKVGYALSVEGILVSNEILSEFID